MASRGGCRVKERKRRFSENSDEDVKEIDSMKMDEVREELRKLNLKVTSSKAVLHERLRRARL